MYVCVCVYVHVCMLVHIPVCVHGSVHSRLLVAVCTYGGVCASLVFVLAGQTLDPLGHSTASPSCFV